MYRPICVFVEISYLCPKEAYANPSAVYFQRRAMPSRALVELGTLNKYLDHFARK